MFRTVPLSIIRLFHCSHSNGICHKDLLTACEQDQDGTESRPDPARQFRPDPARQFRPDPARKLCIYLFLV